MERELVRANDAQKSLCENLALVRRKSGGGLEVPASRLDLIALYIIGRCGVEDTVFPGCDEAIEEEVLPDIDEVLRNEMNVYRGVVSAEEKFDERVQFRRIHHTLLVLALAPPEIHLLRRRTG
jgi:hypothetical protein